MLNWQKERKEKLSDLFLATHVIAYLITMAILIVHRSAIFTFESSLILLIFFTVAVIFILGDYYFHSRDSKENTLLIWNIAKHSGMIILITFVFFTNDGELLSMLGALYLLPVVLACISLGRNWGFVFAGVAASIIMTLSLNLNNTATNQTFEVALILSSIFFLVAWFMGSIIDVEKKTTSQLVDMANLDDLTGLANHRYFQEQLQSEIEAALKSQKQLSLILMDIDFFKKYNDTYGHIQGDLLLKELSSLLSEKVPSQALLARYGGEEFAITLPNTSLQEANNVAEALRQAVMSHEFSGEISQPYEKLSVSMGVANLPEHAKNKQELLVAADEALYSSKFTGRNKVRTYLAVLERLCQFAGNSDKELLNSLRALMTVVNAKDKYTYGHSERVAYYAKLTAKELGMEEDSLRLLEFGAFLHDLGKVEIPREVLNKKGSLTDEEWEVMCQHPIYGAEILKPTPAFQALIPMVLYHHENHDGSGYPHGLKGEEIPILARIIRLVDSFDAITTYRPYRSPLTKDEALEEIAKGSGSHYDPKLVRAFVAAMKGV